MRELDGTLRVLKYTILGNSYLLLPPDRNPGLEDRLETRRLGSGRERVLGPQLVRRLCSLHDGIGSSGLVLGPIRDAEGRFALHVYNEDGSRCNFSGNAVRMVARYLVESGELADRVGTRCRLHVIGHDGLGDPPEPLVSGVDVEIAAPGGRAACAFLAEPRMGRLAVDADPSCIVETQRPTGAPPEPDVWLSIPALAALGRALERPRTWTSSSLVDLGNKHCVTFVETEEDLPAWDFVDVPSGALVALAYPGSRNGFEPLDRVFPNGCNLQFVHVQRSADSSGESRATSVAAVLHLRNFERGGGPTRSTGSSAAAAAAAAFARGLVGSRVRVVMPGGEMIVGIEGEPASITGIGIESPVTRVAEIEIAAEVV